MKIMDKKLIRLTEGDLHRIVKESVNRVLSESINELDPRTYASYAQKRAAQGQDDKAMSGQLAARDAWNKQYGENDMQFNGFGDRKDKTFAMNGNDYNVRQTTSLYPSKNNNVQDNSFSTQTYNPYNDSGHNTYVRRNKYTGDETQRGNNSLYNPQAAFNGKRRQGINVARQMAQGNGKYVKGKGWQ